MKKRSFFSGLQGKMLMYFLLMTMIPLIVVSYISYQKGHDALQDTTRNMLHDMAAIVEGKVETIMGDRFDDIKAWSTLPTFARDLQLKNFHEANDLLTSLDKSYDQYQAIMILDAGGNLVASSDQTMLGNKDVEQNQANREWFKKARAGEVFFEGVNFSSTVCWFLCAYQRS